MRKFEKVSQSLKYDSNYFSDHKHINIYMDTNPDHITPLALRVRGNYTLIKVGMATDHSILFFCVILMLFYIF